MTFGQLLLELEGIKKTDPKMLEAPLEADTADGHATLELATTLPGRLLYFKIVAGEETDAG